METHQATHAKLIQQIEALVVYQREGRSLQLETHTSYFKVVTTKPVNFQFLKESMHKSWGHHGMKEIKKLSEGLSRVSVGG
jgi:hypothetical protein